MNVLQEILIWSAGRPAWQRDALRRLITAGELSDDDLHDLTEICKGDLIVSPVASVTSLSQMGVDVSTSKNVGSFTAGQKAYLAYHRTAVLLRIVT